MNFKFTKTDRQLSFFYFLIATPLSWTFDFKDYDFQSLKGIAVFALDNLVFILIAFVTVYIMVFRLIPRYLPKMNYLKLFLSMVGLLLFMGAVDINYSCLMYKCKGFVPNSFEGYYYGMLNLLENVGVLATLLLGKKLFDTQLNFERSEKARKEDELRFLKTQIDPHFLFNNLNTVDSLIDSDPQKAKSYLNRLGQLYRYLISSKDQEVVELSEELEFAKNYIYLIEQRFGSAYSFKIQGNENLLDSVFIPPGALQVLLENVVKHNQASNASPIETALFIGEKSIIIENEYRKKTDRVDSMGTGIKNLKKRYQLLTDKTISIESNGIFRVELPFVFLSDE